MQKSYLFYDLETSGLNKCFDQVLQFAAVRTDLNFQELERHEIFVKLNPDVIPSPEAFLTHKISPASLTEGCCEYEAVSEIHKLFNTPGTISVGYNNLGFDDEFLRFSFYRNLFDPYSHQYANGCRRMDIYPMVVVYYLFKSRKLNWPNLSTEERISLKLEDLASCNGLSSKNSHNAMGDVLTTLALAKKLRQETKVWSYLINNFEKDVDIDRVWKLPLLDHGYQEGLLIDGSLGFKRFYQLQALCLGMHRYYSNQNLWIPLDQFLWEKMEDDISNNTFVVRKRFGEMPLVFPLGKRFDCHLTDDRLELAKTNRNWLKNNGSIFNEVVKYHRNYRYPEIPNLDIDASLYQLGFMAPSERRYCIDFHNTSNVDKFKLTKRVLNNNLRIQALRILGRNYPEILIRDMELYGEFQQYLKMIKEGYPMVDYKNEQRRNPSSALEEIATLKKAQFLNNKKDEAIIEELAKYIQSW